ncbi:NUDIX domain-containing protein [Patescibacteria group bacterium]|nr:NUDIX domain-containing protein [Patescibacteria group bacterium]
MSVKNFQIRGDKQNPYHLSVGLVVVKDDKIVLLQKGVGDLLHNLSAEIHTLPRETVYSQESIVQVIDRCAKEELGLSVDAERYLGSLITYFHRRDGTQVEKTTIYFKVNVTGKAMRAPAVDEVDDKVAWVAASKAVELLKSNENDEYKIVGRVTKVSGD